MSNAAARQEPGSEPDSLFHVTQQPAELVTADVYRSPTRQPAEVPGRLSLLFVKSKTVSVNPPATGLLCWVRAAADRPRILARPRLCGDFARDSGPLVWSGAARECGAGPQFACSRVVAILVVILVVILIVL